MSDFCKENYDVRLREKKLDHNTTLTTDIADVSNAKTYEIMKILIKIISSIAVAGKDYFIHFHESYFMHVLL